MKHVAPKQRRKSVVWTILGILAELMLTAAAVCALYIAWQMWWTGVQAEHNQIETRQSVSWSDPGQSDSVTIAQAQEGDPPAQPQSAQEGELIAQVYIPRFGSQWQRNLVEGTSLTELNKHGLGHYKDSQMPGQVGNFAFAGHRNGYGQPLGDVDKLQEGDPIIVRTQDYWYVYHYTSYKIVLPTDIEVVAANPKVKFVNNEKSSIVASVSSLKPWILGALAAYAIIFLSALVAWRWPYLADVRAGRREKPEFSLYGGLMRLQPGVLPIRLVLMALLIFAAAASCFEWLFPWAATNIPALQEMSNYTAI